MIVRENITALYRGRLLEMSSTLNCLTFQPEASLVENLIGLDGSTSSSSYVVTFFDALLFIREAALKNNSTGSDYLYQFYGY